jgi:hypothetical protein
MEGISISDILHKMMTTINSDALYISKLFENVDFQRFSFKKIAFADKTPRQNSH